MRCEREGHTAGVTASRARRAVPGRNAVSAPEPRRALERRQEGRGRNEGDARPVARPPPSAAPPSTQAQPPVRLANPRPRVGESRVGATSITRARRGRVREPSQGSGGWTIASADSSSPSACESPLLDARPRSRARTRLARGQPIPERQVRVPRVQVGRDVVGVIAHEHRGTPRAPPGNLISVLVLQRQRVARERLVGMGGEERSQCLDARHASPRPDAADVRDREPRRRSAGSGFARRRGPRSASSRAPRPRRPPRRRWR